MILPIVTLPATSLRQRSKEIEKNFLNSKEFKNLLKNIISTMYHDDGIGICSSSWSKYPFLYYWTTSYTR